MRAIAAALLTLSTLAGLMLLAAFPSSARAAAPGLVAEYGFDEGTGSQARDASPNGLHGSVSGATWSPSGRYGGALSFDGVDDRVIVPDAAALDLTGALTLEAWVRPSSLGDWGTVVLKEHSPDLAYALYATSVGSRASGHAHNGANQMVQSSQATASGTWTHLAVTYDGTTLRIYANGTQTGSLGVTGPVTTSSGVLSIGGNAVWANEWFSGLIDEVRVYGRALSPAEIQTDMTTPVTRPAGPSGLVAAYGFDDGSGSQARDATANGLHGSVSGASWTSGGKFGSALSFDGVNDRVVVPDAAALDLTTGMTLEAWVNPTSASGWRTAVLKENGKDLAYALYAASTGSRASGHVYVGSNRMLQSPQKTATGTWTHLATTYDGSTLRIYANGTQTASLAVAGPVATSDGVLTIGGTAVWANEWFAGRIDEVRVYARALSAAEIQADMTKPVTSGGDTQPPSTPANFRTTGVNETSISVAWNASTDDVGVTGYRLLRNGTVVGTTAGTTHTFGGLACGTSYTLGVDAADAAGNRSSTATLTASTSACSAPPPPSGSATKFVSPSGSDANPCTQPAPCRTFDRAYEVSAPGEVVEVAAGSYAGQTIDAPPKSAGPHIVFQPAAGASVTLGHIRIERGSWMEFRDFTVTTSTYNTLNAQWITYRGMKMRQFFIRAADHIRYYDSEVGPNVSDDGMNWITGHAPVPDDWATDIVLDGMRIHDFKKWNTGAHVDCIGIDGTDGLVIRNSRIWNCAHFALIFGGDPPCCNKNITLENNFLQCCTDTTANYAIGLGDVTGPMTIRFNSISGSIGWLGGTVRNVTWDSNVIGHNGSANCSMSTWSWRYNVVGSGSACGGILAPTGFRRPPDDLHLNAGAAAINAGNPSSFPATDIDGQARPLGGRADAGADEAG